MLNANEFFEIVGELYHGRYRRLRPGKSESPFSGHDSSDEDNVKQFKDWVQGPLAFNDAIERIAKLQDKIRDLEYAAESASETMLGLKVVVDPSMPPGTVEMRGPHNTVRVEGLESETEVAK